LVVVREWQRDLIEEGLAMHGVAFVFLTLAFPSEFLELPSDIAEMWARDFALPLRIDTEKREQIEHIVFYVSQDRGKTWTRKGAYKATDDKVNFKASKDGLYWFALQVEYSDGTKEPSEATDLTPGMKVYVNTERKPVRVQKTYDQLQREVKDLRKTVEELQRKVRELEADRKSK
jgi:hypothetical protein